MIKEGKFVGTITYIGKEETVGQNNLRKKTFVIGEVSDKEYKGSIAVDLIKDRVDILNDFKVWDNIEASLNFRANEYNGKFYNGVNAWSVKKIETGVQVEDSDDILPFN